jgi:NADH-quinone oxidoreductase subunit C/D
LSTASTSLQQSMTETPAVIAELYLKYGESSFVRQNTAEGMPTLWLGREKLLEVLKFLRDDYRPRFEMLLDVTAIDERLRVHRDGQPESCYHTQVIAIFVLK